MDNKCSVYNVFDIVAKKWTFLIILSIYRGESMRRYSEIKKDLKEVTPKILSYRLKELESQKLIYKKVDSSSVPVKTYYFLSESGVDLVRIIQELKLWGLKWNVRTEECKRSSCTNCKVPLYDCPNISVFSSQKV